MDKLSLGSEPEITIALRRNAKARRISLRISQLDGKVTLTMPNWTPAREAIQFAKSKENWIRNNLATRPAMVTPGIGGSMLFEGRTVPVIAGTKRSVAFDGENLLVPGDPDRCHLRLAAYMKTLARQRLNEACDIYAAQTRRSYGSITLRDTRSRWGSCTTDGNLMFSWRLIMAPPVVLDYVAAHEVAHLSQMNHSPAYWKVVEGIFPNYKAPRKWLRTNGQTLHAYRLSN